MDELLRLMGALLIDSSDLDVMVRAAAPAAEAERVNRGGVHAQLRYLVGAHGGTIRSLSAALRRHANARGYSRG